MNSFQTAAMNAVKVTCIIFILKVTQCINGQISDTNWQLGYNYFNRGPYEAKRLLRPLDSLYDQPQLVKRRLDRFRFFHKGLGKRSTYSTHVNTNAIAGDEDSSNVLDDMRTILDKMRTFQNMRPYDQQYLFATNPTMVLKNTKSFRRLSGINNLYNKRAPEIFSENLYPLQSGKQKLEATLDQTLDTSYEPYDNNMIEYDNTEDDGAENIPVKQEVTDDKPRVKIATKTPFDLIFASPDLKTDLKTFDTNINEDSKETNINVGQRSKRWWASNMFRRFRSPKSWTRGVKSAQHVDPALYFIGLGR